MGALFDLNWSPAQHDVSSVLRKTLRIDTAGRFLVGLMKVNACGLGSLSKKALNVLLALLFLLPSAQSEHRLYFTQFSKIRRTSEADLLASTYASRFTPSF